MSYPVWDREDERLAGCKRIAELECELAAAHEEIERLKARAGRGALERVREYHAAADVAEKAG